MSVTLILGDCLQEMKKLDDNSVDMIFTDPPYGHNNNNGDLISRWEAALGVGDYVPEVNNKPILNDGAEANDIYRAFLKEANRVLRPGACCCCCCGGGGGPDPQYARWTTWMDEIIGFKMGVVWDKGPMGMGWHYRRSYEMVLVGQKKGAACKWYDESNKIENVIRTIPKIIPSDEQHPTVKPVELAAHFIRLHTRPGEVVLDPFMGSGTTGVAAVQEGRSFIGMELDPKYYEMAKNRIASANLPLFDAAACEKLNELKEAGE
jgi:DNA modification methylase